MPHNHALGDADTPGPSPSLFSMIWLTCKHFYIHSIGVAIEAFCVKRDTDSVCPSHWAGLKRVRGTFLFLIRFCETVWLTETAQQKWAVDLTVAQTWRRRLYVWCSCPWNGKSSESPSFWQQKGWQNNCEGAPKCKGLERLKKEFGGF